jgi:hypothetical protein
MGMRRKPVSADAFVMQASTVIEQEPEEEIKIVKTELRLPERLCLTLNKHIKGLETLPSRNQYILFAIKEQMKRDKTKNV